MKINIKNISLSAMAIIALASCSDVVDYSVPDRTSNSGAPAISQIYDVQDTGFVAPLNGGVLNQMIHIKGQNLANAKKIRFNDVDVDVRQVYATTDEAWVKIPRAIPGVQNDSLVYETDKGKTKLYFPVSIPTVEIEGLKNEFAQQGNQVQITSELWTSMVSMIPQRQALQRYTSRMWMLVTERKSIVIPAQSNSPAS